MLLGTNQVCITSKVKNWNGNVHLLDQLQQDFVNLRVSSLFELNWSICKKFNALLIDLIFTHAHESFNISHHGGLHSVVTECVSKDLVSIELRVFDSPKTLELGLVVNFS